jgi:ABC-type oligopeptide transport system substrate-binding subunit
LGHNPKQAIKDRQSATTQVPTKPESPLKIKTAVNTVYFGEYSAVYNELANALAELNLTLSPANQTMREFAELRQQGTADLIVTRWIADYPDADRLLQSTSD